MSRRVTVRITCDGCGRETVVEGACSPSFDSGALAVDLVVLEPERWGVLVGQAGDVRDVCPSCWQANAPELIGLDVGVRH